MAQYRVPVLSEFEWQQAVDDRALSSTGSEAKGYRYLIDDALGAASGDFVGQDNKVATAKVVNPASASDWYFDDPLEGMIVYVKDEDEHC